LNLHGSYPASTSIESDNIHIRGKLGGTGTDDDPWPGSNLAHFGRSLTLSGALHPKAKRLVSLPAREALALAAQRIGVLPTGVAHV